MANKKAIEIIVVVFTVLIILGIIAGFLYVLIHGLIVTYGKKGSTKSKTKKTDTPVIQTPKIPKFPAFPKTPTNSPKSSTKGKAWTIPPGSIHCSLDSVTGCKCDKGEKQCICTGISGDNDIVSEYVCTKNSCDSLSGGGVTCST